ncbi:ABC transporter substrate-binding protein [Micromonospora sp. M12]
MGTTKVPAEPKRVVVLDTDKIDTALSLGITPVGAATAGEAKSWPTYFGADKLAGIKEVGVLTEPDLEAINALKPDLILGSKFRQEKFYDELAAIAPTVFTDKVGITWKDNLLLDGRALGREQQAKDLLATYEKRARTSAPPSATPPRARCRSCGSCRATSGCTARTRSPASSSATPAWAAPSGRCSPTRRTSASTWSAPSGSTRSTVTSSS